ncbi:MAG: hypothetical protein DI586_11155, partial [Micavibrio aeruginosavorus]
VQEIQSTISYLARFGYAQDDGLDIMLISKPDFGSLVEGMLNFKCNFNTLTLQRAAEIAGLNIGRGADPHYAESLHVAWYAKKLRPLMPMKSREIETVAKPRKMAFLAMLAITAGFGYLLFNLSNEYQALNAAQQNAAEVQKMQVLADQIYQEEIKRKEALGIDIKLIQGALGIYKEYDKMTFDPLPMLEAIGSELQGMQVSSMDMAESLSPAEAGVVNYDGTPASNKSIATTLNFTFPGTIEPQVGNEQLDALRKRLTAKLPGYEVKVSKQLADLTYTGEISSETGFTAARRKADDVYTGGIEIIRELKNAGNTGTP